MKSYEQTVIDRDAMLEKTVEELKKEFPDISGIKIGHPWNCDIFLGDCAEGGTIDGHYACNYYGGFEDPSEEIWIMGVHHKLEAKLRDLGFHAECLDPGTYGAYED